MTDQANTSGLSGVWSGEYWYGLGEGLTPYAANLTDQAGALTGTTLEDAGGLGELTASLTGARSGLSVGFTKVYDEERRLGACPIAYSGLADASFETIEGDWVLMQADPLRGGFRMRRISPRASAAEAREATELATVGN